MVTVEVNGISLHVLSEGQGSPLVFLHGFPLTHAMWDAQRREFRETHHVLIPDLRGFGRSSRPEQIARMEEFADDVHAMLAACDVNEPVTLCGLSMGGYIAMAFARKYPEQLARLVLCDTRSQPDTPEAADNRRQLAEKVLKDGPRIVADSMLPKLFGPRTNEDHPEVVDAVRNLILAGSPRGIAAAQRGMAERPDSTPSLKDIAVPTLVIVGEYDLISPPDEMRAIADAIPGARFEVIQGAGHMSPMERPEAFNAVLRAWLG